MLSEHAEGDAASLKHFLTTEDCSQLCLTSLMLGVWVFEEYMDHVPVLHCLGYCVLHRIFGQKIVNINMLGYSGGTNLNVSLEGAQ